MWRIDVVVLILLYRDTQNKLSDIINTMGEASAAAQGLTKPITTADKLKNSEHTLYLLVDPKGTKYVPSFTYIMP